jgi:hypothetical protein
VAAVKPARVSLLVACAALAGCGTNEEKGDVGERLEAGSVKATVTKFSSKVPGSKPDPGRRYLAAHLDVCKDSEQSINAFAFGLALAGGGEANRVYPQRSYGDGFSALRDGCEKGWLVFSAPADAKPRAVTFKYEDTGQGGPGGDDGEKLEFEWAVPG